MPRKKKTNPKSNTKKVTTTTTTVVEETIIEKKPGKTYYTFVVDRSGSMGSIKKQTIDNFNEQIGTLKSLQEEYPNEKYYVTLVLFDHEILTMYKDVPLNDVAQLNDETYVPRGMTSLHDAIGMSVSELKSRRQKELLKEENEALVVVLTDGYENNSKEWSGAKVKELMDEVEAKENWTVSFIGSNKDSMSIAKDTLGIQNSAYVNFADTTSYERFYNNGGFNKSIKSRAMAKASGASTKASFFAGALNDSGELTGDFDQAQVDTLIQEQTKDKKDKKDKKDDASK